MGLHVPNCELFGGKFGYKEPFLDVLHVSVENLIAQTNGAPPLPIAEPGSVPVPALAALQ